MQPLTSHDIVDQIFSASSYAEVLQAEKKFSEWMSAHPDDMNMMDVGGTLYMLKSAYELTPEELAKINKAADEYSAKYAEKPHK